MMGDAEFPMARIAEAYLIKASVRLWAMPRQFSMLYRSKRGATPTEGTLENLSGEKNYTVKVTDCTTSDVCVNR